MTHSETHSSSPPPLSVRLGLRFLTLFRNSNFGIRISLWLERFKECRGRWIICRPLTRPPATLSPSDGERDGVRGCSRYHGRSIYKTAVMAVFYGLSMSAAFPQTLTHAQDGSGVRGYRDTPKQPWSGYRVHDADRPAPARVDPGPFTTSAPVPQDATILFEGKDLSQWQSNGWRVVEGSLEAAAGNLVSKAEFGSCQIHLEWLVPTNLTGHLFDRGNNGVLLMGLYEIQIFDSYTERLYPDGQAGSVYGQTPPLVNVCRPPGQWQTYDILFTPPQFKGDELQAPAYVTVIHNGVVVQNHQPIYGETVHRELPQYKQHVSRGPLALAGHNCPVRLRNIWVRRLSDN
jgi:hypothetical protein